METLNPYFQKDCQELIRGHFGADESLVWVKECGYQDCFGYVVVSNKRVITAVYNPQSLFGGKQQRVTFYKPKSGLWGKLSAFQAERCTYLAPTSDLSEQETKKRKVYEAPLIKLTSVNRQDYQVKLKSGTTTMVEVTFVTEEDVVIDRPLLYTKEAGDELVALVQKMIAGKTAVTIQNPAEDINSLIASLAELHEAGVLSDEEFEAKKQEILAKK
jgi:hypothetical protein